MLYAPLASGWRRDRCEFASVVGSHGSPYVDGETTMADLQERLNAIAGGRRREIPNEAFRKVVSPHRKDQHELTRLSMEPTASSWTFLPTLFPMSRKYQGCVASVLRISKSEAGRLRQGAVEEGLLGWDGVQNQPSIIRLVPPSPSLGE